MTKDTNQKESTMDALVLSTLLFNTIGTAVIVLALAVAYVLPQRSSSRR